MCFLTLWLLCRFARFQDLTRLPTAQVPEREDGGQMLGARARLALFPVVDRLGRCADQQAAFGGGQSEAPPLGCHALGAEASAWRNGVLVGGSRLGRLPRPTKSAKVALELADPPLQRGDLRTVSCRGLLQGGSFASDFFASDAGDFVFQNRCDVGHGARYSNRKASILEEGEHLRSIAAGASSFYPTLHISWQMVTPLPAVGARARRRLRATQWCPILVRLESHQITLSPSDRLKD